MAQAHRLYGWSDLPAGAVDAQFQALADAQFQALVEAVAATPPALAASAIPAPQIEVDGAGGQAELTRLGNRVGGVEDEWHTASAEKSVETSRCRVLTALRANAVRRWEAVTFRGLDRASDSSSRRVPGERLPAPDARGKPGVPGTFRPVIRRLGPTWRASRAPGA